METANLLTALIVIVSKTMLVDDIDEIHSIREVDQEEYEYINKKIYNTLLDASDRLIKLEEEEYGY